jgi:hypothetical protein
VELKQSGVVLVARERRKPESRWYDMREQPSCEKEKRGEGRVQFWRERRLSR